MRTWIMAAALVTISNSAHADVLKCWDTYSRSRVPVITATIVSDSELADLTVTAQEEGRGFSSELQANGEAVAGTMIVTRRSPYVGNQEFLTSDFRLVLPPKLDNDTLLEAQKTGIGMGKGENGVAIGSFRGGGDGAGSHISVRLRCRSYAK